MLLFLGIVWFYRGFYSEKLHSFFLHNVYFGFCPFLSASHTLCIVHFPLILFRCVIFFPFCVQCSSWLFWRLFGFACCFSYWKHIKLCLSILHLRAYCTHQSHGELHWTCGFSSLFLSLSSSFSSFLFLISKCTLNRVFTTHIIDLFHRFVLNPLNSAKRSSLPTSSSVFRVSRCVVDSAFAIHTVIQTTSISTHNIGALDKVTIMTYAHTRCHNHIQTIKQRTKRNTTKTISNPGDCHCHCLILFQLEVN